MPKLKPLPQQLDVFVEGADQTRRMPMVRSRDHHEPRPHCAVLDVRQGFRGKLELTFDDIQLTVNEELFTQAIQAAQGITS